MANDSHILSTKDKCICNIHVWNFDESLTTVVVNFEQLGPEWKLKFWTFDWVLIGSLE